MADNIAQQNTRNGTINCSQSVDLVLLLVQLTGNVLKYLVDFCQGVHPQNSLNMRLNVTPYAWYCIHYKWYLSLALFQKLLSSF